MGCGASSAAGDKAIVSATRIDSSEGNSNPRPQKPAEAPASTEVIPPQESNENQDVPTSNTDESELTTTDSSTNSQNEPSDQGGPEAPSKALQNTDSKQDGLDSEGTAKSSAPNKAAQQDGFESGGAGPAEKTAGTIESQAGNEVPSTPPGGVLLSKRLSQNKLLPPLKSPLATVDPSKDPFAKPVLPTAIPVHSAAPSSPGPTASATGTPTTATEAPGPNNPGSVASTPKPADSPVPSTPIRDPLVESKPPGPSNLSKSSSGSAQRIGTEPELVHTPRGAATEAALEALMSDVSGSL